jgi:hypothetical protein
VASFKNEERAMFAVASFMKILFAFIFKEYYFYVENYENHMWISHIHE